MVQRRVVPRLHDCGRRLNLIRYQPKRGTTQLTTRLSIDCLHNLTKYLDADTEALVDPVKDFPNSLPETSR